MNLGLILAIGESFEDFRSKGQDKLLINQNIKLYSKSFKKIFVFSYKNESEKLFGNVTLVKNVKNIHRYLYSLILPLTNKKEIKSCDVLRGLQATGGIPCLLAKILYRKPFVINYGYNYQKVAYIEKKYFQALLYKLVLPLILKYADAVIIKSSSLEEYVRKFRENNIFSIPNGVDINKFGNTRKNLPKGKLKILFVGRLERQKNLIALLKGIRNLNTKVIVTFIGDGSEKKKLKNLAKENKIDLKIIKSVDHDDLPKYYKSSDVFALLSLIEGSPKVLLEAMASGMVCIGSDSEGISNIIENKKTGILVGLNPNQLELAINFIINNPKIAHSLGENAQKFIQKKYNAQKLLEEEVKIIKSLSKHV